MNKRLNDLQAFYESLRPVRATQSGSYTFDDRFRDFRAVFFGDDRGRRVLAQIIDLCEGLPITLKQMESHPYLASRAGQREIGMRIVQFMGAVPSEVEIQSEDQDD